MEEDHAPCANGLHFSRGACAQRLHEHDAERKGAVSGAAIGGAAGAILGDDEAALAGAAVGAAAGWYLGCREEGRCGNVDNRREAYDPRTGRYYFYDPQSGRYFYENGEPYRG